VERGIFPHTRALHISLNHTVLTCTCTGNARRYLILRLVEHSMDQCNKITNYMATGTLLTSETFPGVTRTLNIIS